MSEDPRQLIGEALGELGELDRARDAAAAEILHWQQLAQQLAASVKNRQTQPPPPPPPTTVEPDSSMRRCAGCGEVLGRQARFCPRCGAAARLPEQSAPALSSQRVCAKCGQLLSRPTAKFCGHCGAAVPLIE
jgi:RNA polymerase subunit RPABC4/transcription elongation factor Spt4